MSTELILATGLFIMTATIVFSVQPISVMGQTDLTGKSVILRDDAAGNERGWDPDGNRTTFWIYDDDVTPTKSTVLVNTIQDNYVTCSVDWMDEFSPGFEVNCINEFALLGSENNVNTPDGGESPAVIKAREDRGPSEGGELRYTVFNSAFTIDSTGPLDLVSDLGNLTATLDVMTENRTALAGSNMNGANLTGINMTGG